MIVSLQGFPAPEHEYVYTRAEPGIFSHVNMTMEIGP